MAHGSFVSDHTSAPLRPLADFIPFKSIFSTLRPRFFHPKIVFPRVVVARGVKKERRKKENSRDGRANVLINAPPVFADEMFDD